MMRHLFALLLALLHLSTLLTSLNVSHLLTYSIAHHPEHPYPSPFLKEVLRVIAQKKKWDLRTIAVSRLEKVRFGYSKRHDFRVRIQNKRDLVVRYCDKVDLWHKFENESSSFEELVNQVSSEAVLSSFLVDGPFVLVVDGASDRLSLQSPVKPSSSGVKQIIVGEDIRLEIKGAKEVSFALSSCNGLLSDGSYMNKDRHDFWPLWQSFCQPLIPIRVMGSVYVTAFRRNNSSSFIEKKFVAKDIVELSTEKCYERNTYRRPTCPIYLVSRIIAAQNMLTRLLSEKTSQLNHLLSFRKANMKASTFVRFQLELERDVAANDSHLGKLPEWRTKPTIERLWFDIVAIVDWGKLKPVTIKQVKPFISVDSTSWSHLFSNLSLSEFSSILAPSHPLTLDVKW